jgi:hypothetical protein
MEFPGTHRIPRAEHWWVTVARSRLFVFAFGAILGAAVWP